MKDRARLAPGTTTRVGFAGDAGRRVFHVTTGPDTPAAMRVIICPPVGGEAARNYRREVTLARSLAEAGIETVRFHYRGSGQSDPLETIGFATMLEDAGLVAGTLGDGIPTVWMGTRVGGSVAACMAASRTAHGLIVWDPVLDPVAYFRDILRARVFSAFRRDEAGAAPTTDLIKDLQTSGWTDLLGYRITASLLDELCAEKPLTGLDLSGRSVLLVELRRKGDTRAETVRLGQEWQSSGATVTVIGVALREPWWYGARSGAVADEGSDPNQALLKATVGFVDDLNPVLS